jgi:hypothetical protein
MLSELDIRRNWCSDDERVSLSLFWKVLFPRHLASILQADYAGLAFSSRIVFLEIVGHLMLSIRNHPSLFLYNRVSHGSLNCYAQVCFRSSIFATFGKLTHRIVSLFIARVRMENVLLCCILNYGYYVINFSHSYVYYLSI